MSCELVVLHLWRISGKPFGPFTPFLTTAVCSCPLGPAVDRYAVKLSPGLAVPGVKKFNSSQN